MLSTVRLVAKLSLLTVWSIVVFKMGYDSRPIIDSAQHTLNTVNQVSTLGGIFK